MECWFESYLPDLDYGISGAVEEAIVAKLALLGGFYGYRVDAVKHMHDHLFYSVRHQLDRFVEAGNGPVSGRRDLHRVGAVAGGEAQIAPYVNDTMLHGQFDFPLYLNRSRLCSK